MGHKLVNTVETIEHSLDFRLAKNDRQSFPAFRPHHRQRELEFCPQDVFIHKSQGMSLDGAVIDLGRSFTYGMGYVALSRVKSMNGLYLSGINRVALQLHPQIYEFDARLKAESQALAELIDESTALRPQSAAAGCPLIYPEGV